MRIRRFRVRTLMMAVAAVAIALGAWITIGRLRRLSEHYEREAARFARGEGEALGYIRMIERGDLRMVGESVEQSIAGWRISAEYCARMKKKYERAARSPWWSLSPDPEPPW